MAEEARARGNAAYSAGNFTDAVKHYTEAITLSPSNHLLYCDRSAAYASLYDFPSALSDAKRAVQLDGSWPACHWRLGTAYLGLGNYPSAISTYQNGLRLAPENEALKYDLAKVTTVGSSAPFSVMQLQQRRLLSHFQQQQQLLNHVNMHQQRQQQRQQLQQPQNMQLMRPLLQNWQEGLMRHRQHWQFAANSMNGDGKAIQPGNVELSPTTNAAQTLGFGSSATDLADVCMSTGVMSLAPSSAPKKQKRAAADAFDLLDDFVDSTEQQSNIRATNVQWQGLEGAQTALKRAREVIEKVGLLTKMKKEAARKNLEPEESVIILQTRVKDLENELSKVSDDHTRLNKELKEAASYFGWKARIEMMEEFVAGKHVAWNPSKERALFLEAYPRIQTKEKDDTMKEADQPAQDIKKESVEVEDEETFQIVQRELEAFVI